MVFTGVPSKGCAPCRAKKTKCDQSTPSCGQCLKAGRNCYGYRDRMDLLFRNETNKVTAKARTSKTHPATGRRDDFNSEGRSDISALACQLKSAPSPLQLFHRSLSVPLEDEATNYFFHSFVMSDPVSSTNFLSYIPSLCKKGADPSPLPEIISSIGMASLSNIKKDSRIMFAARRKHTLVLQAINGALQDPEGAKLDTTFAAVMLLCLFETVTCSAPQSMKSWVSHISGATEIARVRGRDQLQTETGRRLLQELCGTIVIDCLQRRRSVPRIVLEWRSAAKGCEHEIKLLEIIASLCTLRKDEKEQTKDASTILGLAASIDANLAEWVNGLPWEYSYMTRTKGRAEDLFCGYYHVYTSARKALIWNSYRCARILVNDLILNSLAPESTAQALGAEQCLAAQTLMNQLSNEICASVLFHLWGDYPMRKSSYTPRAAAGHALLWPLYLVGLFGQPILTRSWVIAQLDKIGGLMGIQQATSLANLIRMNKEVKVWDKMKMNNVIEELAQEEDDW